MKGGLGSSSIILDVHNLWPGNLDQCGKKVEIKSQKVFEANYVCRSCMEKLVGVRGRFLPPKSWIWLNELKWEYFLELSCRRLCHLTIFLNCAWEVNQLNYPFELGLLISHSIHFQEYLTPQKSNQGYTFIFRPQRKFY